jgi:hypothetical protein
VGEMFFLAGETFFWLETNTLCFVIYNRLVFIDHLKNVYQAEELITSNGINHQHHSKSRKKRKYGDIMVMMMFT